MSNKNSMTERLMAVLQPGNNNMIPSYQNTKPKCTSTERLFTHIEQRSSGLYAIDNQGRSSFLTAMTIDSVTHIFPDKLFRIKDFYQISITNAKEPLLLTSAEYDRNETLMNKLAEASGTGFEQLASPLRMGKLFKAFLSPMVTAQDIKFYYGWESGSEGWCFSLHNGKTHSSREMSLVSPSGTHLLSETIYVDFQHSTLNSTAALMETITNIDKRSLLFLWLHAASLYSLLNKVGFPIGVGLCLNSQSPQFTICLRELLEWYDDKSIPITETPKQFLALLTQRKDQPLLISDTIGETKNREVLMNCVREGCIPLTIKGEEEKFSLQALPTVIGNCRSTLCSSAEFMLLEINDDDLVDNACNTISTLHKYLRFHIKYFLKFIQKNISTLERFLAEARRQVFADSSKFSGLTEQSLLTICAFLGLDKIIREYYAQIYADNILINRLHNLISNDWYEYLFDLLTGTSSHEGTYIDIVNVFATVVKDNIKADKFDVRGRYDAKNGTACAPDKNGIIYLFDGYICLTRPAYLHAQKSCNVKAQTLLSALRETGALIESNINATTGTTRRKVYTLDGIAVEEFIYMFVASKLGISFKKKACKSTNSLPVFTLQLGISESSAPIHFNGGNNNHIFISGGSGLGKSTKIKELVAQLPSKNVRCIIFDGSGDYASDFGYCPDGWPVDNCKIFKIKNSLYSAFPFCLLNDHETPELRVSRLLVCFTSIFDVGPKQKEVLEGALFHYLQNNTSPSLNGFLSTIFEESDVGAELDEKVKVSIQNMCNYLPDGSNMFDWELDSPGVTIVDLHKDYGDSQKSTIIQLMTGLILHMRNNQPRQAFSPVVLVYDECQHLNLGEHTQIGTLLREGRKWGFSGWFSTQWVGKDSVKQALGDVSTRLYFQPNRSNLSEVAQDLCDFNSETKQTNRSMLSKLQTGQFVCVSNNDVILSQAPHISSSDYSVDDIIF